MTSDEFAYWLQGYFEISETDTLTERQVGMIKEHLQLVFIKLTGKERTAEDINLIRTNQLPLFDPHKKIC